MVLARHSGRDQVAQQFFGIRIPRQQLAIESVGLIRLTRQMQGDGSSKQGRFEIGLGLQALLERVESPIRGVQMQQADSQSEPGLDALGIDIERFLKCVGGFLPALQPFEADALIVGGGLVLRIGLRGLEIALGGVGELVQLELDVPHRRIQLDQIVAALNRRRQLLERGVRFPSR